MLVNTFNHYDSDDSGASKALLTQSPVTSVEIGNNITITEYEVSKVNAGQHYKIVKWEPHTQFKLNSLNYICGKRGVGKSTFFNFLYSLIINQIEEFFVFTSQPQLYSHLTCESHIFTDFKHFESLIEYFKKNTGGDPPLTPYHSIIITNRGLTGSPRISMLLLLLSHNFLIIGVQN